MPSQVIAVEKNFKVKVLTRAETLGSKAALIAEFKEKGAEIVSLDYGNYNDLVRALKGVNTVVSAISGYSLVEPQLALIKAAKEAGVARFYPSEYGIDDQAFPEALNHPIFDMKKTVRKAVIDAGLDCVVFFTSAFSEWLLSPFYAADHASHTIEIVGTGNEKFGSNRMHEIGDILAESIGHPLLQQSTTTKTVSPRPKQFYLSAQGLEASFNDFLDAHEKATGVKWIRNKISIEEAEKRVAKNNDPFGDFGLLIKIWIAKGLLLSPNNVHSQFHVKADKAEALYSSSK